jgi:hypothetical protein
MPRVHQVYPSATDLWLMALLYAGPVLLGVLGLYCIIDQRDAEAMTTLMMSVGLIGLNLLLTRPCRYTLTEDTLNVRCGMFSQTIALKDIASAELSSSWLSGPALSLRRVRIRTSKKSVLVSPVDREQFIADLLAAAERCRKDSPAT